MPQHRVVILIHQHGTLEDQKGYTIRYMADVWKLQGVEIVVQVGPGPALEADVAIQHVDLTRVPVEYLACMRQYPVTINAFQADLSKRVVSRQLVKAGDDWRGPVIVKTDFNSAGWKEAELAAKGRGPARVLQDYPIFDNQNQVPDTVWQDQSLIVERFLPERDGDDYVLRQWQFFGDKEYGRIGWCDNPVIKARFQKRTEELWEVPERIRELREELAFDFGRFDYGIVDGEPVLWDANRTPTMGLVIPEERWGKIRLLAEGLQSYLDTG